MFNSTDEVSLCQLTGQCLGLVTLKSARTGIANEIMTVSLSVTEDECFSKLLS